VRRRGLWAKHTALKRGAIENTLGEHIGNLRNILGTKEKEKESRHFECILSLPIGCMKFLFPKLFVSIFGLG
jgi:hypothetical protein